MELDSFRAKQIIEAKENIHVLYKGSPVWIESINGSNIAEVTSLKGDKTRLEVPVNMLEDKIQ